jgi:hypothetical protein
MSDKPYVSSIIFKYGDTDNVKKDVKTLNEILSRQGNNLVIDVLAETIGQQAITFKFTSEECARIRESLLNDLREAINERI